MPLHDLLFLLSAICASSQVRNVLCHSRHQACIGSGDELNLLLHRSVGRCACMFHRACISASLVYRSQLVTAIDL
jgi:hypothetical protein